MGGNQHQWWRGWESNRWEVSDRTMNKAKKKEEKKAEARQAGRWRGEWIINEV